jgi:hypothetical protein
VPLRSRVGFPASLTPSSEALAAKEMRNERQICFWRSQKNEPVSGRSLSLCKCGRLKRREIDYYNFVGLLCIRIRFLLMDTLYYIPKLCGTIKKGVAKQ